MLEAGIKGRLEQVVTEELTAAKVGSGLANVYATPYMIALIENTAWSSIADQLAEGEGTVGTKLSVEHLAATPVGMKVWCETELVEVDRRRLVFRVEVYDEAGKSGIAGSRGDSRGQSRGEGGCHGKIGAGSAGTKNIIIFRNRRH